jgi:hypothetical protein
MSSVQIGAKGEALFDMATPAVAGFASVFRDCARKNMVLLAGDFPKAQIAGNSNRRGKSDSGWDGQDANGLGNRGTSR